jgi:uncharacterized SAM-binding protein YcdF (DUF218 family)
MLNMLAIAATAIITAALSLLLAPSVISSLHLMLAVTSDDIVQCDFIIVLGYALFKNGTPTEPLKGRVEAASRLLKEGKAKRIILSGSHTCPKEGLRCDSEANAMLIHASKILGVNVEALDSRTWWKEEKSTSTRENAVYSLGLIEERGLGTSLSILIVTSPFHQLRSLWTFEKAAREAGRKDLRFFIAKTDFVPHRGFGPLRDGYGAKLINASIDLWDLVREILAILFYKYKGFI